MSRTTAQGAPAPEYRNYAAQKRGGPASFFSRRGVAAGVLALTVLLGSFFGCYRSVIALRPEIQGTRVEQLLDMRVSVALNLVTLAEKYVEDPLVKQVAEAASVLAHSPDSAQLGVYNGLLGSCSEDLISKLEGMELSARDAAYLAGFRAELRGSEDQLLRTEYRDRATAFNETITTEFPARLVSMLAGIEQAPVF